MRILTFIVTVACVVSGARCVNAEEADSRWAWGVALGSPQTLAVTLEHQGQSPGRVQFHVGTIAAVSSAGARALMISPHRDTAPYAFAGGGVLYVAEGDGGGSHGATGFFWAGAGLRFLVVDLTAFVELGVMAGMDTDKGYESVLPAIALGIELP